jgi:hypothetical protein
MEYPKINSLWKRTGWYFDQGQKRSPDYQEGRQSFLIGDYASPEFGNIKRWAVDEKIDGMNVRVYYRPFGATQIEFKGRTDAAQMPLDLQKNLETTFSYEKLLPIFQEKQPNCVEFFGEGIGPKIQSGGYYAKQPTFVCFAMFIDGWWLERSAVRDIAGKLGVDVVPQIGVMTEEEIIAYVKSQPLSIYAKVQPHVSEGVVCRPEPLMLFRNGHPIMWKLKCKEFT